MNQTCCHWWVRRDKNHQEIPSGNKFWFEYILIICIHGPSYIRVYIRFWIICIRTFDVGPLFSLWLGVMPGVTSRCDSRSTTPASGFRAKALRKCTTHTTCGTFMLILFSFHRLAAWRYDPCNWDWRFLVKVFGWCFPEEYVTRGDR